MRTETMVTTLKLQNIKCGGCTNSITRQLLNISGINEVQISEETCEVSFSYKTVNDLTIAERALIQMGYPPEGVDNTFAHKTKSYVSCMVGNFNKQSI